MPTPFSMTPGTEIHLLSGTSQTIGIVAFTATGYRDIASEAATSYDNFSSVVTRTGATFAAAGVGETVGTITFTDTDGSRHTGHLAIRVHAALRGVQFGNNRITVRAGEQDYVATVYAEFDDLAIADVTGHSWLAFDADAGAPFSLLDTSNQPLRPVGRIRGLPNGAGQHGPLRVRAGQHSDAVQVHVSVGLSTPRPVLATVRYHEPDTRPRNILFIAEGYTDKARFDEHVEEIVDELFSSPSHSPYHYLSGRLNVWSAFEAAPEPGITFGPAVNGDGEPLPLSAIVREGDFYVIEELTALVGLPGPGSPSTVDDAKRVWREIDRFEPGRLHNDIFAAWRNQRIHGLTRPKDSPFGFIYGGRASGPLSQPANAGTGRVPDTARWHLFHVRPHRYLTPDPRRTPSDPNAGAAHYHADSVTAFGGLLGRYLDSLKYGTDTAHPYYNVAQNWKMGQRDEGLVAVLVYDEYDGGSTLELFRGGGGVVVRHPLGFAVAMATNLAITLSGTAPILDHTASVSRPVYSRVTGIAAHELAHALGLGDEYENEDRNGQTEAPDLLEPFIEVYENLTHAKNVLDTNDKVIESKIKWNWPRIVEASALVASPVRGATTVTVQLEAGEGYKWDLVKGRSQQVYLRVRTLNRFRPGVVVPDPAGPFTIHLVTGDTVELAGTSTSPVDQFPADSVLYVPVTKNGSIVTAVDGSVLGDLGRGGPFGTTDDCSQPNLEEEMARKVSGYSAPRNRDLVIGLYQGGGSWNCGVFRPAGDCKMRHREFETNWDWWHFIPYPHHVIHQRSFCFVCKYALVNNVRPGIFALLDREYPEDC